MRLGVLRVADCEGLVRIFREQTGKDSGTCSLSCKLRKAIDRDRRDEAFKMAVIFGESVIDA